MKPQHNWDSHVIYQTFDILQIVNLTNSIFLDPSRLNILGLAKFFIDITNINGLNLHCKFLYILKDTTFLYYVKKNLIGSTPIKTFE